MLEGDDGTVIHQHLGWLHDRDERVRAQALIALVNHVRAGDAKALRAALDDRDASCAEWALRGLVQLNPPDIDDLLHKALRRRPYLSSEATLHLARRGDRDALSQIVLWVQGLSKGIPRGAGWGLFEVDEMCQILVERRPPGTEAALRAASSNSRSRVQRDVFGALAVLGDTSALTRLRALARTGGVVDRAHAIRWLGICKDRGSLDFLREALEDREPIVRDAAREALKGMAR
jgi:HEAT repeat protein